MYFINKAGLDFWFDSLISITGSEARDSAELKVTFENTSYTMLIAYLSLFLLVYVG